MPTDEMHLTPKPRALKKLFITLGDTLGFTDPLKEVNFEVSGQSITMSPKNRSYHYTIRDPRNPIIRKWFEQQEDRSFNGTSEYKAVRKAALAFIEREFKRYFQENQRRFNFSGQADERIGGIPIEEWEKRINKHLRKAVADTIEINAPPEKKPDLKGKYRDVTMRKFLAEKSLDEGLYAEIGYVSDMSRDERTVYHMTAKSMLIVNIMNKTIQELGMPANCITRSFSDEVLDRLKAN